MGEEMFLCRCGGDQCEEQHDRNKKPKYDFQRHDVGREDFRTYQVLTGSIPQRHFTRLAVPLEHRGDLVILKRSSSFRFSLVDLRLDNLPKFCSNVVTFFPRKESL